MFSMNEELAERIKDISSAVCRENEVELFSCNCKQQGKRIAIDIFADKSKGGITIDQCAALNKKIIHKIDDTQLIDNAYTLSVSSPGIDWPLNKKEDFLRVIGKKVKINYWVSENEQDEITGDVLGVDDHHVTVKTGTSEVLCNIDKIIEAMQII